MRDMKALVLAVLSCVYVVGCSDAPESTRPRTTRNVGASTGGGGDSPSGADKSQQSQTPTPGATVAPAPVKPLKTEVCENPTCTENQGAWSCTAKNTAGAAVKMDCEGGGCTCVTDDEVVTQFGDENLASDADARTLFFSNCRCL